MTSAIPRVTDVTDCGVADPVVSEASGSADVFESASAIEGVSPPTRSATAAGAPEAASVRNVCTGNRPATAPARAERTEAFTTRTV